MSATIDIENFQSWSDIFVEIKRQKTLKTFMFIEGGNNITQHQEWTTRSFSSMEVKRPSKFYEQEDRIDSQQDQKSCQIQQLRRPRYNSAPSPSITDRDKLLQTEDQGTNR